jgi:hypothetical protein
MAERDPAAASRRITAVLIGWNLVVLTAVLVTAVIGILDVKRACTTGLGELDPGQAEISLNGDISVNCDTGHQVVEIPIVSSVAVLLFAGFGFVVSVLLTVVHVAYQRKAADS